jgi:hypothetical protein
VRHGSATQATSAGGTATPTTPKSIGRWTDTGGGKDGSQALSGESPNGQSTNVVLQYWMEATTGSYHPGLAILE